eukprot:1021822-Rhodomonas_salina.1
MSAISPHLVVQLDVAEERRDLLARRKPRLLAHLAINPHDRLGPSQAEVLASHSDDRPSSPAQSRQDEGLITPVLPLQCTAVIYIMMKARKIIRSCGADGS